MIKELTNPYVGLRPFEIDESILFFGRNDQTLELLQRLHKHHFVAVVGSSGSGKSSLIRAGLIPSLKAGFLVNDSDDWFVANMKPGQNPLYNLCETILLNLNESINTDNVKALEDLVIEDGVDALINKLLPKFKETNTNFFLLVDQFEELFRYAMEHKDATKRDEALDFVNIILQLSQQKELPFYVVLTMRTDFIGDCVQFMGLAEALNESMFLVPRMNRQQLKTIIEGPAKLLGGQIDPNLTTRLLNELGKVKDELPLLQHCLLRMWDYEYRTDKNGIIDIEDYQKISGIEKALCLHADEALEGMTEEEIQITEKLFKALTSVDDNGRKIRRPALLSEIKTLTEKSEEQILAVVNKFIVGGRSFLIVVKTGESDDKVIDISHESLIRQWNTLSTWVEKENESSLIYVTLAKAAELHAKGKKDYLIGSELQAAIDWRKAFKPTAVWANRYREGFDNAIKYLEDSYSDWSAKKKAELNSQKRQRLLIVGLLFLGLIAVATLFTTFKFKSLNKKAELQTKIALEQKNKADLEKEKSDSLMGVAYGEARKAYVALNEAKLANEMNQSILDTLQKTIEKTRNAKSRETLQKVQEKIKVEKSEYTKAKAIVNGYNVIKVSYRSSSSKLSGIFYVDVKSGEWIQVNYESKNKRDRKYYKEKSRSESSVFLESLEVGIAVELHIESKKIFYRSYYSKSDNNKELFTIIKSEM